MRNFWDTFETSERSVISAFSISITVPLIKTCCRFCFLHFLRYHEKATVLRNQLIMGKN